jgi:acetyl esterase/lipase
MDNEAMNKSQIPIAKSQSATSDKRASSRNGQGWFLMGAVAALAGVGVYLRYKDTIDYNLRLLNAKRIGDKFYAEYPYVHKDLAYGPNPAQKLDVYLPDPALTPGPQVGYPTLIFVHGGNWNSGNKELYAPAAQRLMPYGVAVVMVGYTLHPQATYRQQTTDVAKAIAWTLDHIADYGGDPQRVIVSGHSAGAQLTALAMMDEKWLAAQGGHTVSDVCGYIGLSGPYDINAQMAFERSKGRPGDLIKDVFEGEGNFSVASPVTYARPGLPPMLIIHGDKDETVPVSIAESFHAALKAAGTQSELRIYPRTTHSGLLFDALAQNPARLVEDLAAFTQNCLPVK